MDDRLRSDYARAVDAERRNVAARRRPPADGADLERLLATASTGDPAAWNALVARFGPQLLRAARAHGLSRQQAEDAVQDTWIRLLRNIERVRQPAALGGWLSTTVRRESLRVRGRSQREMPTSQDPRAEVADTSNRDAHAEAAAAECGAVVERALEALPARHRLLMRTLFDEPGPSYQEVAARLDMPVGSLGPIRGRCLARLRLDTQLRHLADELD
jgi:RNA polymerase sigma factor (sigma-70 family)